MADPYKTPESEIGSGLEQKQSKTGWKIFFWVLLTLEGLSILSMIFDPIATGFDIVAEAVIYSFIFMGLFGFSYDKKILKRYIWGYLIPIGILFDIYSISNIVVGDVQSDIELYFIIGFLIVIGLPIMVFQYLALYKYRFKSENIWS